MHRFLLGASVAAAVLLAACAPTTTAPSSSASLAMGAAATTHDHGHGGALTKEQKQAVSHVRAATARFRRLDAAKAAGYTNQYPPGCAESPAGAQAFHFLNPALVDGTTELLKPELLMYEPQKDGSMELIGVDYVIPFDKWTSDAAPTLLGVPMMRNEPLGVWALHIWTIRENPNGTFAAWNPTVSCKYAK